MMAFCRGGPGPPTREALYKDEMQGLLKTVSMRDLWPGTPRPRVLMHEAMRQLLVPDDVVNQMVGEEFGMALGQLQARVQDSPNQAAPLITSIAEAYAGRWSVPRELAGDRIRQMLSERESTGSPDLPYRILSFDGGGIRGLFQAVFTEEIDRHFPVLSDISLLAGTSTGAIVAVALALGKSPPEIVDLYRRLGPHVFGRRNSAFRRVFRGYPAYSSGTLRSLLVREMGSSLFQRCAPRTVVVAVALDDFSVRVFDSGDRRDGSITAVDVLLASTAAPTYFCPHFVADLNTTFIDGGLACNNPAIEAVRVALRTKDDAKQVRVLSIGTGTHPTTNYPSRFQRKGKLGWAVPTIEACMHASSSLVHRNCTELLSGENYVRVDHEFSDEIRLDDCQKAMEALPPAATSVATRYMDRIVRWYQGP